MYLKFKINEEQWKVYECKNYSYRMFRMVDILDFLIEMGRYKVLDKLNRVNNDDPLVLPLWLGDADLIIIPNIDSDLYAEDRIVSDKHTQLINTNCIHFELTTLENEKVHVLTTKNVYVEGDKGQTVGRFAPNVLK